MALAFSPFQVSDTTLRPQQADTVPVQEGQENDFILGTDDSAVGYFIEHPGDIIRLQSVRLQSLQAPVVKVPELPKGPAFQIPEWNFNSNFLSNNELTTFTGKGSYKPGESRLSGAGSLKPGNIVPQERNMQRIDWFLGFFLIITLLFIWMRKFYGKYFTLLANALVSFQISAKLFRERNVLMRRVSTVLDLIYYLVLSIFTFEIITHFNLQTTDLSRFNMFMLLLNIIMLYSLVRMALLRVTGFLFLNQGLFAEYIHSTFVVNKGAGIILFPLVVTAHYFPYPVISAVLLIGVFILGIALIWKSIRAYQIIRRKDIVFFYLILYLCTLEILPLLLGYKLIITLI